MPRIQQLTSAPHGHILTNASVWSPDSRWLVYDVRSDPAGACFDGSRIERVDVETGAIEVLYEAQHGACVGVATYSPVDDVVAFIHGPEHPTADWSYSACHRQGVLVRTTAPGRAVPLDARNIVAPFTPGALRGGSHVHVFSPDGALVSFTYNDHVLEQLGSAGPAHDIDQRNVGVCIPRPVDVPRTHPRNHAGTYFSVLITQTTTHPRPGSDDLTKACEEAWVGTRGYLRADGRRQSRALAFQGEVITGGGQSLTEAFIVDLPDDLTVPGAGPLEGTATRRPCPPRGTVQRRLTYTADRRYPGLQGPRHWLRSSPDGTHIALLMKDDAGVVQLWTVAPTGGLPAQLTHNPWSVASAFTWSPAGDALACVLDHSVFLIDAATGRSTRLTPRAADDRAPRPEACVFAPDGRQIAYVTRVPVGDRWYNQLFRVRLD